MGIYKNAVILKNKKRNYKPVSAALVKEAEPLGYDIHFIKDHLKRYHNILFFVNRVTSLNEGIENMQADNIGWWFGDYCEPENLQSLNSRLSFIFTTTRSLVEPYKKMLGVDTYYMPLCGMIPSVHKMREVEWNVLFIGRVENTPSHLERKPYLERMKKYGFKLINNEPMTRDMCYLYKNTPINLSISRYKDGSTSNRLFNILACGGFALVRYFPGLEEMFENYRHLVWFHNIDELDELTEYYLNHPDERKQIAKNGNQIYLNKHTVKHRIQNIFDIMDGKTKDFYGYL